MSYCDADLEILQYDRNFINNDLTKKLRPLYFIQLLMLHKIKLCYFIDFDDIYLDKTDCTICHTVTASQYDIR